MGFLLFGLIIGLPVLMIVISALWDRRHRRLTGRNTKVTRRTRRAGFTYSPAKTVLMNDASRGNTKRDNYGDIGKR